MSVNTYPYAVRVGERKANTPPLPALRAWVAGKLGVTDSTANDSIARAIGIEIATRIARKF